jgi:rhomboid-like protein
MSLSRVGGLTPRLIVHASRPNSSLSLRRATCSIWGHLQNRSQHNRPQRPPPNSPQPGLPEKVYFQETEGSQSQYGEAQWAQVRVRYLRPAIWALTVSGGIFAFLTYLQARQELKPKKSQGWLEAPQWTMQRRGPPTPTEMASQWWQHSNSISKVSYGIIAANSAVHLSSFVAPRLWDSLWHLPVRNVNYTLFTSAFVHSGPLHLFVNMYATYNFMLPVGYSRAFEGNPYQVLSFFLATGVLSGFAQHWATLISPQKRVIPETMIRCGGASGALLGIMGVFCTQYPHAGLGIILLPFHFEAQYVLPAIMLFDFVGMVRGYSFVNFGHAVSCTVPGTLLILTTNRHICLARQSAWLTHTLMAKTGFGTLLYDSGSDSYSSNDDTSVRQLRQHPFGFA